MLCRKKIMSKTELNKLNLDALKAIAGLLKLKGRSKYKRKGILIADFSPIEDDYKVNRLYTTILISLGFMSFMLVTYGLQSIYTMLGIPI